MIKNLLRPTWEKFRYRTAVSGMENLPMEKSDLDAEFARHCAKLKQPRVLELGTRRSQETRSTKHENLVPNAGEFLGTDIQEGIDVDVVADVHKLSKVVGEKQFDIIVSCSSFEHFKYPHLAAHEVMKTLKIGGLLFIQTHQSFPLHAYPFDYFRFSREALAGLFGTKMGFNVIATDYEFPVRLFSQREAEGFLGAAFLNSRLLGEKVGETPADYVYEYDG